jgi:hypothetical protein
MKIKSQPMRTYGTANAVLRQKFIAMKAYVKNQKDLKQMT